MKAFDNSSGKWPVAMPEIATFLLVSLSAQLLRWQNPGEACGELLQIIAVNTVGYYAVFSRVGTACEVLQHLPSRAST